MTPWRVRDFQTAELEGILHLWEMLKDSGAEPVYALSEVLASCEKDYAVVAVHGDDVVGAAVGRAAYDQGWIVFLATLPQWRGRGIGTILLALVETRMALLGLNKLSVLVPEGETRVEDFLDHGFAVQKNLRYFERRIPLRRQELEPLSKLGGGLLPRDLWEKVAGMRREKELIGASTGAAARGGGSRRGIRCGCPARRHAVRSARHREDHLRQGDSLAAGMAIRRGLPVPACGRPQWTGWRAPRNVP